MKKTFLTIICALTIFSLNAEVRLPAIISSGMVLQRNAEATIWGWAEPNTKISLKASWSSEKFKTTANDKGKWSIDIPTAEAMWEQSITINDGDKTTLDNIMIGDVWICSGQSNMEMMVIGKKSEHTDGTLETLRQASQYPNIRLFTVKRNSASEPRDDCDNYIAWCDATADNVAIFSATAYFFGRTISSFVTDVPIGLVHSSWGGTRIEAWMSEEKFDNLPSQVDKSKITKKGGNNQVGVNRLYNGMIHPITPFTAKGFIWYQGESNRLHSSFYHYMMEAMVSGWREDWGSETMPFYYVQIAPHIYYGANDTLLPMLIESQYKALKMIPNSAIAATTDIGNSYSIHPSQKQTVGERLAYIALHNDYGVNSAPATAPTYKDMTIKGDTITVSLNDVSFSDDENNSIRRHDGYDLLEIKGFEIAGEDRAFYPATAWVNLKNSSISMKSEEVPNPVAARYAFHNLHEGNVMSCIGLPLVPFRTDNW